MSETTNLKLKKHDNVSTNTNQFDLENYMNGNWDKIDVAIGNKVSKVEGKGLSTNDFTNAYKNKLDGLSNYDDTEIKEDISAIQEEQETQNTDIESLKIENENIKKENTLLKRDILANQITDTVEGNSLELKDCSTARLVDLGIEGNNYQKTRSGKNLLYFLSTISGADGSGLITKKNNDGSLSIQGTTTRAWDYTLSNSIEFKAGETYTFSLYDYISAVGSIDINFYFSFSSENGGQLSLTKNNPVVTRTINVNQTVSLKFSMSADRVIDFTAKIQVEKSTTATEGEEYGVSPSPDYSSGVKSCGDNINIIPGWIKGKAIDSNTGVEITNQQAAVSNFAKVDFNKNPNYIISGLFVGTLAGAWLGAYNSNKEFLGRTDAVVNSTISINKDIFISGTPQGSGDIAYIRVLQWWSSSSNITADTFDAAPIKLEVGTKATGMSPYNQGSISIVKANKNLAKINEANWELTKNNTIKNKARNTDKDLIEPIKLKKGETITVSLLLKSKPTKSTTFTCFRNNVASTESNITNFANFQQSWWTLNTIFKRTFTVEEDTEITYTMFGNADSEIFEFQFWIEKGEITGNYIKHQEQVYTVPTQKPFRAISNVRDRFIKKDGKRYECHKINRVILDENSIVGVTTVFPSTSITYRFDFQVLNNSKKINANKIICDKFLSVYNDNGDYEHCRNGNDQYPNNFMIYINRERLTDLSTPTNAVQSLKEWLQTNPLEVEYILAEPELIECTPEQNEILDKLENDENYKELTYIYSTDEIQPNLKATYSKDPKIQNKRLEDRISKIEALLSTTGTSALLLDNLENDLEREVTNL